MHFDPIDMYIYICIYIYIYIYICIYVYVYIYIYIYICSQVAKNAIKSHGTVLLYPYVCICYVFHVGIDSKFYSKVNRQNM